MTTQEMRIALNQLDTSDPDKLRIGNVLAELVEIVADQERRIECLTKRLTKATGGAS